MVKVLQEIVVEVRVNYHYMGNEEDELVVFFCLCQHYHYCAHLPHCGTARLDFSGVGTDDNTSGD